MDECTVKNGGCSHDCTNTIGSYICACPDPELSLADDKHTCEGKIFLYSGLLSYNLARSACLCRRLLPYRTKTGNWKVGNVEFLCGKNIIRRTGEKPSEKG